VEVVDTPAQAEQPVASVVQVMVVDKQPDEKLVVQVVQVQVQVDA